MKPSSGYAIICFCLILSCFTGVVTGEPAQYDKSVSISLHIDNGKITPLSTELYYGSAPHLFPMQGDFKGELVAADGSIVTTFTVWDPRIQFGDAIIDDGNGQQLQGVLDRQNSADFVVTFPFEPDVTEFRLYNSADGTLLSSVSLQPVIDSFFASNPRDPDNPALSGSEAPGTANAPITGTTVPDTGVSGQLWGLLLTGTGIVLLLGGAFIYTRYLQVKPKTVLIVDDNPDVVDVIASMLQMGGYVTQGATSGVECLKELDSAIPSLILLDIGMQPLDGWETLKQIKKNPATRDIPVIMLTAHELMPKDVEDYGICIEDYLIKPATLRELNDAITHVFERRQMIKEKIAAVKGAGIDRNELCECARLTRVVDVNKRLWNHLVSTYNLEAGIHGPDSEIPLAIKNTKKKIREQEHRLQQIQRHLGSGAKG